jgi:hypothetical protein
MRCSSSDARIGAPFTSATTPVPVTGFDEPGVPEVLGPEGREHAARANDEKARARARFDIETG